MDIKSNDDSTSVSSLPSGAYPSYGGIIPERLDIPILRGEAERQRLKDVENWEINPAWPTDEPPLIKSPTDYEEVGDARPMTFFMSCLFCYLKDECLVK